MARQTKVVMLLILATAVRALAIDFDMIVKDQKAGNSGSFAKCPSGWVHYDGRCYLYQGTQRDWVSAEEYCLSLGANLVSINSEDEYQLVKAVIRANDRQENPTYIGLSGYQKTNSWFWSDGSKLTFTKWNPGEPNNAGGVEGCVHMNFPHQTSSNKNWNDISCANAYPFVCVKRSD